MAATANIGDKIIFQGKIEGVVRKVNENSVIVGITKNPTDIVFNGDVTVVNHKNYKIVK
ncbi:DUF2187 family protein [Peribacillus sp. SCS-155]|uniref:DUF2187 family protein n=1 Tax=Peribacillus sedimenti TaxID=3115297 RepID=UPI003905F779